MMKKSLFIQNETINESEYFISNDTVYVCQSSLPWINSFNRSEENIYLSSLYIQGTITHFGNSLSVTGLLATLVTYVIHPSLRNVPGKLTMALSATIAQVTIYLSPLFESHHIICIIVTFIQNFSWLSAFCWMNSLAYGAI